MSYRENARDPLAGNTITELTQWLALNWRGEFFVAEQNGICEGARGALLLHGRERELGAFHCNVEAHGERGFVDVETSDHRVAVRAEPHAFYVTVNGAPFLTIDRASGDISDESGESFGWWTRPFNPGMERAVRPFVLAEEDGARHSHLVAADGRTLAVIARGAGARNATELGAKRIETYRAQDQKEDLAVLVCALLEACFFGMIDAQALFHRQIAPGTVVEHVVHRLGLDQLFNRKEF